MMKRTSLPILLSVLLVGCGDDGGNANDDGGPGDDGGGPSIDAALGPPPDAGTATCTPDNGVTTDDLTLLPVVSGLSSPVFVTAPPGDRRLFVVERAGRVRIVENGNLVATPYLDITDRVKAGGEEGLLGLAFHPDWPQNGKLYVNYIFDPGDGPDQTVIAEYTAAAVDADTVDKATERVMLTIEQDFSNHNGGMIAFGPDGYLYIGMGDGGDGGDPNDRGADPDTLLGSLLRIDVDARDAGEYGIPSDNPTLGGPEAPEVFAYGLRNPWRWSFDRTTGDAYIADVGQRRIEEVNVVASGSLSGANFGWNKWEGSECFNDEGPFTDLGTGCEADSTVKPVAEYGHSDTEDLDPDPADPAGFSITGGYVYRGPCFPSVQGTYFYGDFVSNIVRCFEWDGTQTAQVEDDRTGQFGAGGGISSFGEDGFGELYMTSFNGTLYRIAPEP